MTLPFKLDDEIALVTGGGTGLGFGMAKCFCQAGARVILVGRREEVLDNACVRLGDQASCAAMDATDHRAVETKSHELTSQHGTPTIGWAAVYFCSPAARFITGRVTPVGGGASIGF